MNLLREYIRELLVEEGILGKWVWPTATKGDEPDEPDTEIEKKLYQQLHKYFATSSYRVKGGAPLDPESVKAIQQTQKNKPAHTNSRVPGPPPIGMPPPRRAAKQCLLCFLLKAGFA